MRRTLIVIATLMSLTLTAHAQSFSSGSTGANGALDLSSGGRQIQLPDSGVLNYTTVNIPYGTTLTFIRNYRNTPVIILAQGDVSLDGQIILSAGNSTTPGPGGFFGSNDSNGFGPGGGTSEYRDGRWVGPLSLVPIVGGSGARGGGGGGGAIVVASSTKIIISSYGSIIANGYGAPIIGFACGSGGAIRLVANTLNIAGALQAAGGCSNNSLGVIRLEAPLETLNFTGNAFPAATLARINPTVVSIAPPILSIISIGGYPVPSYSGSRFDTVDLLLPKQLTDPISIIVRGNNIPLGTQIEVRAAGVSGNSTFTPGTLSGTFESSTATATASGLNRTGVTYLLATATFEPPESSAIFNPKGPDQVAKVRVEAAPGAKPKYVYLRGNGTVVDVAKLPTAFLQQFGQ